MITSTRRCWITAHTVVFLLLAGCADHVERPARAVVEFPAPSKALHPEGMFVNLDNLRSVRTGMTKAQLYPLLGAPHFNEGVFQVRKWNYLFDLPDGRAQQGYEQCQYQIAFDDGGRAMAFAWKPASCAALLTPAPSVATNAFAPEALSPTPIRLSADALFAFDSARLTETGRRDIGGLVDRAIRARRIQDIVVVGYTDRIGTRDYNRALSMERAEAVRHYLAEAGVPLATIHVEGRGEEDPIVSCRKRSGHELIVCLQPNRRVELSAIARP